MSNPSSQPATPVDPAALAAVAIEAPQVVAGKTSSKSFVHHAKVIGGLTLVSRVFGLGREIVSGHYLGTALVGSAFTIAFVIPNLFRKLFGEGALSAAFIPLYAQAVKNESREAANDFAASAVNLLILILLSLTVVGEAIIAISLHNTPTARPDRLLVLRLTAIMLPYVLLICGGAFLSGILQVHKRFAAPAAAPIVLNACHIIVILIGARLIGLSTSTPSVLVVAKQTTLAYWLAAAVLVAGVLQVSVLVPSLRAVGFRPRWIKSFWTPNVKKMLLLSLPVAFGTGVLQISVVLDKGISWALMQDVNSAGHIVRTATWFHYSFRLPMELGAPRRLDLAQFLYQFPLGIFAIALATAIFPKLSADGLDKDRTAFKASLRQGIEASLWEGLPASVGLILVAEPTARLMFQHGQIRAHDAALIARSTLFYAGAIWAFSLLQIMNRAFYAIHDTKTPLLMSILNIVINLMVELPLVWIMGESAMAVGTMVSFAVQAVCTLWLLDRRVQGLELGVLVKPVLKMLVATGVMGIACVALHHAPFYTHRPDRLVWAAQLTMTLACGAGVYLGCCWMLGVNTLRELMPRRAVR